MTKHTLIWLATALVGCARSDAHHQPAADPPSSGGAMWGESYFPNVPLTTHHGESVRFFDLIKDKVVAINFIYTKCTDSCPMETARMVEVQKLLADRVGKDVFFYSISIDPAHDTPEVLDAYAKTWNVGPGWTFLTGSNEDVTLLRKKLGVYDADLTKKDHNLSVLIGNQKTGQWMKRSPAENPYVLANQLGSWLHNWKLASAVKRDYAKAPALRNMSTGEEFFRARCAMCHTIGGGDQSNVAEHRVGPDLLDVTKRRDRDWLEHWMMRPDKMLEDKDPLATALLAKYQNIVMPNFRLTPREVEDVLAYVDDESRRLEHPAPEEPPAQRPRVVLGAAMVKPARDALHQYEALRVRLAADDLPGAQSLAAGLAARPAIDLGSGARAIVDARDLPAARLGFGELSRSVIALMIDNPALHDGWFLFRCPMANGYQRWVQSDPKHENPYRGKQMLECGMQLTEWSL
jgi:protein SCO1/2